MDFREAADIKWLEASLYFRAVRDHTGERSHGEAEAGAMHAHASRGPEVINAFGQRRPDTSKATSHGRTLGLPARAPLIFSLSSSWESLPRFHVYRRLWRRNMYASTI